MPELYIVVLVIVSLIIAFLYFIEPIITRQKIKDNKEHGSARWSTINEIKKNFREEQITHNSPAYLEKVGVKYCGLKYTPGKL